MEKGKKVRKMFKEANHKAFIIHTGLQYDYLGAIT